MGIDQLKTYLERGLANELDWLQRAATEWHAQSHMALDIDGYTVQVCNGFGIPTRTHSL